MSILAQLRAGIRSASPAATARIGGLLASALPDNSALALHGDLGTGKTTLVRGLAHALGVSDAVTSPTYTIYTIYQGSRCQLLHMDAYRLHGDAAVHDLLLDEFLQPPFIIAIEWADNIPGFVSSFPRLDLHLSIAPDGCHLLQLR